MNRSPSLLFLVGQSSFHIVLFVKYVLPYQKQTTLVPLIEASETFSSAHIKIWLWKCAVGKVCNLPEAWEN